MARIKSKQINLFDKPYTGSFGVSGSTELIGPITVTGSLTSGNTIAAQSFTGIFNGVLSSSAQIASNISGSFTNDSASFSTRLSTAESELGNTLISGSAQIASDISGSFGADSASLSSRIVNLKTDSGSFSTRTTTLESRVGQSLNTSDIPTFGGLTVEGNITAETFVVSSSITNMTQSFSSGSTIFGDSPDDTHKFTGSLHIGTGSIQSVNHITASGNITGSSTSTGSFGRLEIAGDSSLTGDVTIGGNINIGDADTDSLTIAADLTSNLVPNADSTFNIGSTAKNWKIGHIEQVSSTNITASSDISSSGNIFGTNLLADSASFSTRVTNQNTDSGSFSTRITNDSSSFSDRVTLSEASSSAILEGDFVFTNITASGNISASGDIHSDGRIFEKNTSVIDHATAMAIVFGG